MRVRHSPIFRKLDFVYPAVAAHNVTRLDLEFIDRDIEFTSLRAGPLVENYRTVEGIVHRVMLMDQRHADEYLWRIQDACSQYPEPAYPASWTNASTPLRPDGEHLATIVLSSREDGGVHVHSLDVPGLHLSGTDHLHVSRFIIPAVMALRERNRES